ncbi:activator of HSP90 ATPase [Flavobacterium palustre]|uniref:Activator of HSP90 ATPase n=1 Tax=Flavobacterium palustre TaxID=1476463 RepID=A0ABQ1HHN2_9FLAO|nr:SRPBCC domain-containing protein [Flavobacterium palustre]GGA78192.1 activator of HSP90 ATPase [Flavobacterium palustre]
MITVQTKIQAPIDKIWDLWTLPEHITQWNMASEDWHTPFAENDLKVGGRFKSTMASKDGTMSFDFVGTYCAVLDKKLIAYTIEDGRVVIIVFEELEDGFEVREYFEPESVNSEELQYQGWQAILDNFKRYVENNLS